jgi:DNA repair protein RadC
VTASALSLLPDAELRARALAAGAQTLGDAELVALLVARTRSHKSALGLAARVLDDAGGLVGLARLGMAGLLARPGVDVQAAARLSAGLELGRRAAALALGEEREIIGSFESVVRWARPRLAALEHEEVWLLALDGRNGLKTARRVAQGGLHGCALTPRDVLMPAIRDGASGIVLVHNHPSGEPGPSTQDVEMTRAIAVACDVVGVPLLDHVIVARGGATSLLELGAISM